MAGTGIECLPLKPRVHGEVEPALSFCVPPK